MQEVKVYLCFEYDIPYKYVRRIFWEVDLWEKGFYTIVDNEWDKDIYVKYAMEKDDKWVQIFRCHKMSQGEYEALPRLMTDMKRINKSPKK